MTATPEISAIELDLHQKRLKYISQYLKELRLEEGYTQIEASSMIGISRNSLQNAEHSRNITFLTISKIADYYGLSLNEFFSDME